MIAGSHVLGGAGAFTSGSCGMVDLYLSPHRLNML
jgi:hypothetical protein